MKRPELESIRQVIDAHLAAVVAHGQQAFVLENPAEARLNADRLDKLQMASRALADLEEALSSFESIESVEPNDGEKRVISNHRVLRPEAEGAEIHLSAKGIRARGRLNGLTVTVFAGSEMVLTATAGCQPQTKRLREELVSVGHVVREAGAYRFLTDVKFTSPSGAAMALLGSTANGRKRWHTSDGKPIGVETPK